MPEQRREDRGRIINLGECVLRMLPDGTMFKGIVRDTSDSGAGIYGPAMRVNIGEEALVVFTVASAKQKAEVEYRCQIKHVDGGKGLFGVEFNSKPRISAQCYTHLA